MPRNLKNKAEKKGIYTGTSNVVLPVPNKGHFPPQYQDKSRLCYYASLFNTVEINSTFYKLPMGSTVEKWAAEVPGTFKFTFKLWREITHNKGMDFDPSHVHKFLQIINRIGDKKGCLLIQFPKSLTAFYFQQLANLLVVLKEANAHQDWKLSFEFRHKSWYHENVYALLDEYNAGIVIHDMPASSPPLLENDADFVYLRFHGPSGDYRGSYSDDFLYEYAQYIKEWQSYGKSVYVYFNNTMGDAMKNLITMNKFL